MVLRCSGSFATDQQKHLSRPISTKYLCGGGWYAYTPGPDKFCPNCRYRGWHIARYLCSKFGEYTYVREIYSRTRPMAVYTAPTLTVLRRLHWWRGQTRGVEWR